MVRSNRALYSKTIKIIASIVLFCFTVNTLGYSAPAISLNPKNPREFSTPILVDELNIPTALGKEVKKFSSSGPTVIHIQDAHANFEAQVNIKKIIQYLISEKKIKH